MEEQIFQQRTDLSALNTAVMAIRTEIKKSLWARTKWSD